MPLDQPSADFVAQLAAAGGPATHELSPAVVRMFDLILAGQSGRGPDVGAIREVRLPVAGGEIRIRILFPQGEPHSVVTYFHGGGWVLGDIDLQYDHLGRDLANAARSTVVMVNYRKAPEHRFPIALDDSFAALTWVAENAADLSPAGAPLVVAGDSAGGNIAAVMTLWARDRGGPRIDYQVLVHPVTDCDVDTSSYTAEENQLILDRASMIWFWDHYLPDETARVNPDASPLRAGSHAGLPPALVYVAEFDPLHDEGVAYARALEAAGVPVTLAEASGQMHAFIQMAKILPGYDAGVRLIADHIVGFAATHRLTTVTEN